MNVKFIAAIAVGLALSVHVQAHHSFTMFDHEKTMTISGTVKEFEYINPHCWLHIVAEDPVTGKTVEWSFEMGSVAQIAVQGWKADSVKEGDKITISGHPLKDGSRGGQYVSAKLANGRSFENKGDPNSPNVIR